MSLAVAYTLLNIVQHCNIFIDVSQNCTKVEYPFFFEPKTDHFFSLKLQTSEALLKFSKKYINDIFQRVKDKYKKT